MIAVTGATGQVGRELISYLRKKNLKHCLLVRSPHKVIADGTSMIVPFDYNKPETFANALKDVERLFLVCTDVLEEAVGSFLESARESGVKQVVVISGMGADINPKHLLSRLEKVVKKSKIPYVALRANWFFQNFGSYFLDMVKKKRELIFPDGGAPLSFVDARDIAEVALHFLTSPIAEKGIAVNITGPESLTHAQVAALFSKHLPFKVDYKEQTEAEASQDPNWNDEMKELFRDIRNRITAPVSGEVEKILRKPSRRLEDYIIENKSLWT